MYTRGDSNRNEPGIHSLANLFIDHPEKYEIAKKLMENERYSSLTRLLPYLDNSKTYKQISMELGISKVRISQLYSKLERIAPTLVDLLNRESIVKHFGK